MSLLDPKATWPCPTCVLYDARFVARGFQSRHGAASAHRNRGTIDYTNA
jgi:hypothetical protein